MSRSIGHNTSIDKKIWYAPTNMPTDIPSPRPDSQIEQITFYFYIFSQFYQTFQLQIRREKSFQIKLGFINWLIGAKCIVSYKIISNTLPIIKSFFFWQTFLVFKNGRSALLHDIKMYIHKYSALICACADALFN